METNFDKLKKMLQENEKFGKYFTAIPAIVQKNKKIIVGVGVPIALVLYLYFVGIIAQYVDQFLTTFGGGRAHKIDFGLVSSIAFIFRKDIGKPILILATAFIIFATISIYRKTRPLSNHIIDKERGVLMSKDGTYGTARWLSKKEVSQICNIVPMKDAVTDMYGMYNENEVVTRKDAGNFLNRHVAVYGASGSGKTAAYSMNKIIQTAKMGESMVLTDPKGELFEISSEFLRRQGYKIKVFNLVNPEYSDSWNCLRELRNDDLRAQMFANIVIANTSAPGQKNDFWANGEMNLLKAIIMYVEREDTLPTTIAQAYELLLGTRDSELTSMFNSLPESNPAKLPYKIYAQADDKVRQGILIGFGTRLQVFQNEAIKKITSTEDIVLEDVGREKCAYFVIMSDQDSTLNFLASLFFSFLFVDLVGMADKDYNGKLPVPVNFILDEFPNIGLIPDFEKKISTVRSRRINISVIFQAISQLENRYPKGVWEEILGNCDTQLFLGCNDLTTAEFVSEKIGETTINVKSKAQTEGKGILKPLPNSYKENVGYGKRMLMNADELMKLPSDECIVMLRGQHAFKIKKCWYFNREEGKIMQSMITQAKNHVPKWRQDELDKLNNDAIPSWGKDMLSDNPSTTPAPASKSSGPSDKKTFVFKPKSQSHNIGI